MPDDPLETNPSTSLPPAPVRDSGRKTKCVFCDCVMTADGVDIWHMGEKAKSFTALENRLAKKDEQLTALENELRAVKAERDALRGEHSSSRVGHLVRKG